MGFIHKLLNIALPLFTMILLPVFMLPYLLVKILLYVRNLFGSENLATKVVLVTGAASGIGEQIAYEYARRGAFLSLIDIKIDNLGAVANKARSLGSPDVFVINADVSKVQDCKRFVDETVNYFGRLDHLVNNAGICTSDKAVENFGDVSSLAQIMDVNFWGAVYGTVFAIPHLKRSRGKIVVIASSGGWYPLPRLSIYNASKAAIINFFETLRIELGWVIGITIVTPGLINTRMTADALLSRVRMRFVPLESAEECAKAIVKRACRGDMYVTEPSWVRILFPWKLLCPQLVDWGNRLAFRISPKSSRKKKPYEHLSANLALKGE